MDDINKKIDKMYIMFKLDIEVIKELEIDTEEEVSSYVEDLIMKDKRLGKYKKEDEDEKLELERMSIMQDILNLKSPNKRIEAINLFFDDDPDISLGRQLFDF